MTPSAGCKFSFGVGQLSTGIVNAALGVFLLFYYNQVLGLSGSLAGFALGLAVMVDAVTDPLIGSISDHWRSKLGRRHPFMYASVIPLGLSIFLLFNPLVDSQVGLFLWLFFSANATRTALTLYNIPHMALGAEMTSDYHQRSTLVGYRVFFEKGGALICLGLGLGVFFASTPDYANGQLNAAAYPSFGLVLSVIAALSILWSAYGTRAVISFIPKPRAAGRWSLGMVLRQVFSDLTGSLKNVSFRWLFGGMFNVYIVVSINAALDLYMFNYFWELTSTQILMVIVALPAGTMIGSVTVSLVFSRWEKRTLLIVGTLAWAFWQGLPVVLRLVEFFPANGQPTLVFLLLGIKFVQGIFVAYADVGYGSMIADIVDEHELRFGKRQEGIFFAATYFAAKASAGGGAIVAGFVLDLISWPRGSHIQSAGDIPSETITSLGVFYGPIIASFGFVSYWCFTRYRLTRVQHQAILMELDHRKAPGS